MRKKTRIGVVAGVVLTLCLFAVAWNSRTVLFCLYSGTDEPSKFFYLVLDHVFEQSSNEQAANELYLDLQNPKKDVFWWSIIRTVGVIGNTTSTQTTFLIKLLQSSIAEKDPHPFFVDQLIDALGFAGNSEAIETLTQINRLGLPPTLCKSNWDVARSVYLASGKHVGFSDCDGSTKNVFLSDHLKNARQIIAQSSGRFRTLNEMIVLDSLRRATADGMQALP